MANGVEEMDILVVDLAEFLRDGGGGGGVLQRPTELLNAELLAEANRYCNGFYAPAHREAARNAAPDESHVYARSPAASPPGSTTCCHGRRCCLSTAPPPCCRDYFVTDPAEKKHKTSGGHPTDVGLSYRFYREESNVVG